MELFDPDLISLPNEERLPSWFTFQVQMMVRSTPPTTTTTASAADVVMI